MYLRSKTSPGSRDGHGVHGRGAFPLGDVRSGWFSPFARAWWPLLLWMKAASPSCIMAKPTFAERSNWTRGNWGWRDPVGRLSLWSCGEGCSSSGWFAGNKGRIDKRIPGILSITHRGLNRGALVSHLSVVAAKSRSRLNGGFQPRKGAARWATQSPAATLPGCRLQTTVPAPLKATGTGARAGFSGNRT